MQYFKIFLMRGWIRVRSISDRIQNPADLDKLVSTLNTVWCQITATRGIYGSTSTQSSILFAEVQPTYLGFDLWVSLTPLLLDTGAFMLFCRKTNVGRVVEKREIRNSFQVMAKLYMTQLKKTCRCGIRTDESKEVHP